MFTFEQTKDSKKKIYISECIYYILSFKRGSTISTDSLAKILKYNIDDEIERKKFYSLMNRIKNILIDYGFVIKRITGVGYYILKSNQISSYCFRTYQLKTINLLEKSDKILLHVDQSELDDLRKKEYKEVKELNNDILENINVTIEESKYFKNKEKYNNE